MCVSLRRRLPYFLCTAILACAASGPTAAETLFTIEDVRGDDDGAGTLIYPNRDDLHRGDLDLVRLSAENRPDGIWFVAEMAQPIRSPVGRVTELGQTPMESIARNGFYTFNLDICIDTDRIAGSGQTGTVPGRGVTIDRQFAWEKCIVLTPRPDVARTMMQMYFDNVLEAELRAKQGKVSPEDVANLQGKSELRVNDLFYFPSKVRVAGRRIEFQVPTDFLGGVPSRSWGYTALVTGADLEQTGRPGHFGASNPMMMTMTIGRGAQLSQWRTRSDVDDATPPIIDVLAPDPATQQRVLSDYDTVAARLPAIPGLAPDGNVALAATGEPPTPDELNRINIAVKPAAKAGSSATPAERRTVPARLRTLNQLLADGLITQAEFDELRRKILAEL